MLSLLVSLIYIFLFAISEFRLKEIKQLTSPSYFVGLIISLFGILLTDIFYYEFSPMTYFLSTAAISIQIVSYLCRIYLWDINGNIWSQMLHPNGIMNNRDEYYPQRVNFFDCGVFLIVCLYIYIYIKDLRRLQIRYNY